MLTSDQSTTMDNIQSEKHHHKALSRVWELMRNSTRTQAENEEMDMLVTLVEAYEAMHVPMQPGDPIAFLRYKMEQENLLQQDLIPYIGDKTKVSKVLNRKQELTVAMIQRLSKGLNIPIQYLIPA
jgi:HTH-type transcriptional regulator/antitoxin HigA